MESSKSMKKKHLESHYSQTDEAIVFVVDKKSNDTKDEKYMCLCKA